MDYLDLFTTVLGLIYIWLEYRAHIALWVVGIIMPALDIWLYWSHGLYGDAGMACYYTLAAVYGFCVWKFKKTRKKKEPLPIIHMPRNKYLPAAVFFLVAWAATYYILVTWTNSTVPVLDSFTNALSFVGLWALARKYLEQWLFWLVVDAVCTVLYIHKGIPFKAILYGLYIVIAIAGYYKWKSMIKIPKNKQGAGVVLPCVALLLMMMSCTPFGRKVQVLDTDSLSMAAHEGDAHAQLRMGLRYDRDSLFAEAAKWYELAARQGLAEAQNNLGVMLKDGQGVERDEAQAVEWFRRAAQQGNVLAQSNLGWMFHGGRGVEQNYDSAYYWYRKAALQGHAAAQNNLGLLFRDGLGLPQDSDSARYWFSMAAKQGLRQARHNLETMN